MLCWTSFFKSFLPSVLIMPLKSCIDDKRLHSLILLQRSSSGQSGGLLRRSSGWSHLVTGDTSIVVGQTTLEVSDEYTSTVLDGSIKGNTRVCEPSDPPPYLEYIERLSSHDPLRILRGTRGDGVSGYDRSCNTFWPWLHEASYRGRAIAYRDRATVGSIPPRELRQFEQYHFWFHLDY